MQQVHFSEICRWCSKRSLLRLSLDPSEISVARRAHTSMSQQGQQVGQLPPQPHGPASYKVKVVSLPDHRRVPVIMQAANGPCPLLALANVLLLRGNVSLPLGAPDVSEVNRNVAQIVRRYALEKHSLNCRC